MIKLFLYIIIFNYSIYFAVQHHRTNTVERTEKTEIDKTRSLDELEKSLQAASNSIIATKPTWQVQNQQPQQQQTGNQGFQKIEQTQRVTRKYETRTFETHNQQKQDTVSNEEPRSMSPSWDNVSPHVIIDVCIYSIYFHFKHITKTDLVFLSLVGFLPL